MSSSKSRSANPPPSKKQGKRQQPKHSLLGNSSPANKPSRRQQETQSTSGNPTPPKKREKQKQDEPSISGDSSPPKKRVKHQQDKQSSSGNPTPPKKRKKHQQDEQSTSGDASHVNNPVNFSYKDHMALEPPFCFKRDGFPDITFDPHHLYPDNINPYTCNMVLLYRVRAFFRKFCKFQEDNNGKYVEQARMAKFACDYICFVRDKPGEVAPSTSFDEWRKRAPGHDYYPPAWRLPSSLECPPAGGTARTPDPLSTYGPAPFLGENGRQSIASRTSRPPSHARPTSTRSGVTASTTTAATTSITQRAATRAKAAQTAAAEAAAAQEAAEQAAATWEAAVRLAAAKAAAAQEAAAQATAAQQEVVHAAAGLVAAAQEPAGLAVIKREG